MTFIQNRIKTNLSTSIVATEFSHTVLHRQNVYDALNKNPEPPKRDQTDNKNAPVSNRDFPSQAQIVARNQQAQNQSYLPQPRPANL